MFNDPLKIFVTVVENKNSSHAAEELYLSHPDVSSQIQKLEEELGTKLVDSSSNHLELTQSGEIYYEYAKQILLLQEKAKQEISRISNVVAGNLRVGASYTIGEYILPFVVAEFATQYPKVEIETSVANTREIVQAVQADQLDIALVEGEVNYSDILVRPLMEDEIILLVPNQHPLARLPIVTSAHLQDQVWILRENGSGTRAFSDKLFQEWGINVRKSYIFGSGQAIKQAVSAGLGIALVSRWIVRKELNAKEFKTIRIKGNPLTRSFYLVGPKKNSKSEVMDVFVEQLLTLESTTWRKLGKKGITV